MLRASGGPTTSWNVGLTVGRALTGSSAAVCVSTRSTGGSGGGAGSWARAICGVPPSASATTAVQLDPMNLVRRVVKGCSMSWLRA
jgi:hypothetical protein